MKLGFCCRAREEQKVAGAALNRKGKIWVGCAAAIILAYVVLGGQYLSIDFYDEDDEDYDDEE